MALSFLRFFLHQRFKTLPTVDSFRTDLSGKTVIVVGSNVGLGKEAARHIAEMMGKDKNEGRLILACRNIQSGEEALKSIQSSTGYTRGEVWAVDLGDFQSVKAFADRFEKEGGGKLDLLVMNAGKSTFTYSRTIDNWESTLQVNHLGTALLSLLMLPYFANASTSDYNPRLVIVASDAHFLTDITKEEMESSNIINKLSDPEYCTPKVMGRRYMVTKLLNIFFVRALASRISPTSPVEVVAANPGACKSSLMREMKSLFLSIGLRIFKALVARSEEEGGRSIAYAAVAGFGKPLKESPYHGKFVSTCEVTEVSQFALSQDGRNVQDRLWDETIAILGDVDERVPPIVAGLAQGH